MRRFATPAVGLLVLGAFSAAAQAKGGFFPTYHPPPSCTGGDCKGDDPRNEMPCQGLLCSWASSKSLQPPVTAAQAAEAEKARVATEASVTPAPTPATPSKRKTKRAEKPSAAPLATAAAPAPDTR